MIDLLKILMLGIVEGVTEFLPISSTGHLIVVASLLNFERMSGTFEIFIQLGAVFAVVFFYWGDLWKQAKTVHRDRSVQRLWLSILIAFVPAAALGVLLKDWMQDVLYHPTIIGISLIIGGIIFILVERRLASVAPPRVHTLSGISIQQAVGIGLAQVIALVPGVSRSGASIVGGLLVGLDREVATQFSFYLAIPTLGGATIYELLTSLDQLNGDDLLALFIGAFISGLVAWISIRWLLRYIAQHNFLPFSYYRILAGALILLLVAGGWLR